MTNLLDWTQPCQLIYDLTVKYLVKLNVITVLEGNDPMATTLTTKLITVDKETSMKEFYHETAALPILMKGRSLDRTYSSIIYAIRENQFDL